MNTKKQNGFGGFGVYVMLILLVVFLWYMFTSNSATSDFGRENLIRALDDNKVVSIRKFSSFISPIIKHLVDLLVVHKFLYKHIHF